MSNDPAVRRILPQNVQMNGYTFAPPVYQQQPRETQKSTLIPTLSMYSSFMALLTPF